MVHLAIYHRAPIRDCSGVAQRLALAIRKHHDVEVLGTTSFTRGRLVLDYAPHSEKYCMVQFDLSWEKDARPDSCLLLPSRFIIRHMWDGKLPKAPALLKDVEQLFCSYAPSFPNLETRTLRIVQLGNPPLPKLKDGTLTRPRPDFWFAGLRHLSKVRTLIIEGESLETMLWLESPADRFAPPFPELKIWKFVDCFMEERLFCASTGRSLKSHLPANRDAPHLDPRATVADAIKSQFALRASTFGSEIALHSVGSYALRDNLEEVFRGSSGIGSIEEGDSEDDLDKGDEENAKSRWFD
ncbi:hypothetical protein PENSPDRAFT_654387 [Peniophora sp. CONT]|nr:hypothetical protein PENSPDRAFT_654387 [Peniophora sp. CONT]